LQKKTKYLILEKKRNTRTRHFFFDTMIVITL